MLGYSGLREGSRKVCLIPVEKKMINGSRPRDGRDIGISRKELEQLL